MRAVFAILSISLFLMMAGPVLQAVEPAPQSLITRQAAAPLTIQTAEPVVLRPESGVWDLSRYDSISLKLRNRGKTRALVWAKAENPQAKGMMDACSTSVAIEPGEATTLRLRLMRRPKDPGYEPFSKFYMYFKTINVRENTVDPASIARVAIGLEDATPDSHVTIDAAAAHGEGDPRQPEFFPFIDRFGQYKHTDWPGKIRTDRDFAARLQEERDEMRKQPGPAEWNRWGGWKSGPTQPKTGFFHPKKIDGKWWLIDPEGAPFWSYGPTGVSFGEGSPVTGKELWFEELPKATGDAARYWGKGKGARFRYYEQGKPWESFDFSGYNAERKYGADWKSDTVDLMHARLRNWGFNTLGNWSNPQVIERRKTPYTVAIHVGGPMLEHIPDVFAPEWEQRVKARMAGERGKTAGDPWNLGYFVDNEWTWGHLKNGAMVVHNALNFPRSATKREFVKVLQARYPDIAALNAAWSTSYESWGGLLDYKVRPDLGNPKVLQDCGDFGLMFAEKYFSTVRSAVKDAAPDNLYLGCRFHGHIDEGIVEVCGKHADVISWNVYESTPGDRLNRFIGRIDKPFLVGEWGLGSDPVQTPFRGEKTIDAATRLAQFERYLSNAIDHPLLVGAHYFQFRDQPLSGRPDGEATLRGFVNIADTPRFDLLQANRRLAYPMYQTRNAK